MRNTATDLTEGTPWKIIMRFSIPLFFTFLLQQFYNMVDTIVVGQFLGKDALAGVGSTGAINFMIIGFCMGLANGFVIPVAQRYGAKDYKDMRRFVANSIWLTAFFAAIMSITVCILCRSVLIAMKTPADILDLAYDYIFIIFAGIPITLAYNLLTGIIRSLGDSKSPLIFLLMAAVANIGFDILSVTVLKLGVRGPAFATLLAQAFSVVLSLWCIKTKFPILKMEPGEWKLHGKHIGILCKMGIPMGLQYSITAIGSIVLQSAVNGLGSRYVASVAAGTKLFQVICCPFDAMGATMATYCGQNVGAIKLDRLGQGLRACSLLGLGYALLSFASIFFFAPQMALLFLNPGEEALIGYTAQYITTLGAFFFPLALVNILRFSIQGMGFSNLAILAGVMEMFARMGVATLLVPAIGYTGACFASPAAWICADLFLIPASCWSIAHLRRVYGQPGERSGSPAP